MYGYYKRMLLKLLYTLIMCKVLVYVLKYGKKKKKNQTSKIYTLIECQVCPVIN